MQNKTEMLFFRATPAEKEEVLALAELYGVSMSDLIRRAVKLVRDQRPQLIDVATPCPN
jgi:hypothetical protein